MQYVITKMVKNGQPLFRWYWSLPDQCLHGPYPARWMAILAATKALWGTDSS